MKKNLLPLLLLPFLAACQMSLPTVNAPPVTCPEVGILPQAEKVVFFAEGATEKNAKNTKSSAAFANYRGGCSVKKDHVELSMELDFKGARGKAGGALDEQPLGYFIAVLDADENILQRDAFNTALLFNDAGQGLTQEKHAIVLPLPVDPKTGKPPADEKDRIKAAEEMVRARKVVLGFSLTPEQLAYNTEAIKAAEEAVNSTTIAKPAESATPAPKPKAGAGMAPVKEPAAKKPAESKKP